MRASRGAPRRSTEVTTSIFKERNGNERVEYWCGGTARRGHGGPTAVAARIRHGSAPPQRRGAATDGNRRREAAEQAEVIGGAAHCPPRRCERSDWCVRAGSAGVRWRRRLPVGSEDRTAGLEGRSMAVL